MNGNCAERKVGLMSVRKPLNMTYRSKVPVEQTKQEPFAGGKTWLPLDLGQMRSATSRTVLVLHLSRLRLCPRVSLSPSWWEGTSSGAFRPPILFGLEAKNLWRLQTKSRKQGSISRTSPSGCMLKLPEA